MAKRTKNSGKKEEGKQSHERPFQVFLIVLAFALGILATYIWKVRDDHRRKESLVRLVAANVQHEMRLAKSLREYLTAKKDVERLAPQGFDSIHDPSLYSSLQDSFAELDGTLLVDLQAFHRTMQSCVNMRRLFQEGLSWCWKNKGKPLPKGYLENYVQTLDLVEVRGQEVLSTIESLYPNIKLDTNSKRAVPIVIERDFGGYIPQE